MPWFYAGPEAKPVGPVSLEELQALRARGSVSPDTYVIEQTGQPAGTLAWKRYREVFPDLPPMPAPPIPAPVTAPLPAPPAAATPPAPQPHPLFPSAAPAPSHAPVFTPAPRPDPYYQVKRTNHCCAWGFGLGVTAIIFAFVCGTGLLAALLSIPLCIIGLIQLSRHHEQTGQWLAIWGLVLSGFALIIALMIIIWMSMPFLKAHGLTVTEQTTNDSESCGQLNF
jgi:hypothetical protein